MDEPGAPVLYHHDESMPPVEPGVFGFSRRSLLAGGGALAISAFLAACSSDTKTAVPQTSGTTTATTAAGSTTTGARSPPLPALRPPQVLRRRRRSPRRVRRPRPRADHDRCPEPAGGVRRPALDGRRVDLPAAGRDRRAALRRGPGEQARPQPGHWLRPECRSADVDVQAAQRREDARRLGLHGQRRQDRRRPDSGQRRVRPLHQLQVVRHRSHRDRPAHRQPDHEQAVRHAGHRHAVADRHRVLHERR